MAGGSGTYLAHDESGGDLEVQRVQYTQPGHLQPGRVQHKEHGHEEQAVDECRRRDEDLEHCDKQHVDEALLGGHVVLALDAPADRAHAGHVGGDDEEEIQVVKPDEGRAGGGRGR